MFLVNSRQRYFRCGPACAGQALYRRYGRFFAEFLKDESLVPLGLLALSTCVGLRYGSYFPNLRGFSRTRARSNWHDKNRTLLLLWDLPLKAAVRIYQHNLLDHKRQTTKALDLLHVVTSSKEAEGQEY